MSNHDGRRAHDWIAPLLPAIAAVRGADLATLERFEDDLTGLLAAYPVDAGVEPGLRSQRLQEIRAATAASGYLALAVPSPHGGSGRPAVIQALMQFVCGYYDVNLRDSTGLGHGPAYRAVSELALLTGASGFVADSATAKAVRDLNALLYADGIHDSLYRAAGRTLASPAVDAVSVPPPRGPVLASGAPEGRVK